METNNHTDGLGLLVDASRHASPLFAPQPLIALARERIDRLRLDLSDLTILTEAATGAYGITPVIAALAGARRVYAVARASRYGACGAAIQWIDALASAAGVADRISIFDHIPDALLGQVDIVTNSGHLRPINSQTISRLPGSAVIGLMFEAWERREADVDLAACRKRGIPLVGVNERHPAIDVLAYLGPLAVRLLHDAGVPVYGSRIAVVCDNVFANFIVTGLAGLGAEVTLAETVEELSSAVDAVLVALTPNEDAARVDAADAAWLGRVAPDALVVQFWGDIDRGALRSRGFRVWPPQPPAAGHMAIQMSAIGPEPVVRLQAGGLKAAEVVFRGRCAEEPDFAVVI